MSHRLDLALCSLQLTSLQWRKYRSVLLCSILIILQPKINYYTCELGNASFLCGVVSKTYFAETSTSLREVPLPVNSHYPRGSLLEV